MTRLFLLAYLGLLLFSGSVFANAPQAAIASAHPLATRAGFEILNQGGNAFDAAVAVSAALAVVEPSGSGLGGGGFWLLHRESDGKQVMLDGREKAPLAAHGNMYIGKNGEFKQHLSIDGALSAGIPGMPAGLVHLARHYGRIPLRKSLSPAIRYARQGFEIEPRFVRLLKFRAKIIAESEATARVFLPDNKVPEPGFLLIQPDLADTLEQISANGIAGFYQGTIAEKMVAAVRASGGNWTLRDLADYEVVEREPVIGHYRGIRIVSASPPSSGGIVMVEALNILAGYSLPQTGEIIRKHLIVEALRRAYHDRGLYLGDPDFVSMPISRLLDPQYAAGLRSTIRLDRATSSDVFSESIANEAEGENTTHFSILDWEGNRVSATLSINYPFGSGFMPEGTGVLLNDEMNDFPAAPTRRMFTA